VIMNKKTEMPVEEKNPTELTPYEAMDTVDEGQIVDELEGKLTPEIMETLVYSFRDSTGKEVTGLSWKGTKATWWEFNKKGYTQMTVTDKVVITQGDGFVDVAVYAYDEKRKIGAWGMARGYAKMQLRSGDSVEDRFASAKAISKAQRNALNQLFPSELVANMIKEWTKKGYIKQLTSDTVAQVRDRMAQSGRAKFPTQAELMDKFRMNPAQVSPHCAACGALMILTQRKDGSGVFWSCPNWKTKGCKGLNVDDVDIDGSLPGKQTEKPTGTTTPAEDIPF